MIRLCHLTSLRLSLVVCVRRPVLSLATIEIYAPSLFCQATFSSEFSQPSLSQSRPLDPIRLYFAFVYQIIVKLINLDLEAHID